MKLLSNTTLVLMFLFPLMVGAQEDSTLSALNIEGDFRFRTEQDWNSKKSDGTFRDDRTRLRYRLRAGATWKRDWYETGFRIRTGNPAKQQDPQLTLGEAFEEFGTLPIGLEKAYFKGKRKRLHYWLGKNSFSFKKNNELFWSDNVFPEGVFIQQGLRTNSNGIDSLDFRVGHYLMNASGKSFAEDSYLQAIQAYSSFGKNRFELFPALYLFKNVANIPDGNEHYFLDYSMLHLGATFRILQKPSIRLEADYYYNFQDYRTNDSIPLALRNENTGYTFALKYGTSKKPGDFQFHVTYTYLERYSIVDFMAQNDWTRWDYAQLGSPDGRLSNLEGIEFVMSYVVDKRTRLTMKYYTVQQLLPYGNARETGSRIRLDLDVNF